MLDFDTILIAQKLLGIAIIATLLLITCLAYAGTEKPEQSEQQPDTGQVDSGNH